MLEYTITITKEQTLMVWADSAAEAMDIYRNNPEDCIDRGTTETIYFCQSEE